MEFSVFADPRDGFPLNSALLLPLLSIAGFSGPITESFDENVEEESEDDVEKLVDKPRNEWYVVRCVAFDFLAIFGEMWFLTACPEATVPRSSQSFPSERTVGVSSRSITVTNKSTSLTYTVASSLVCTSPLAVTNSAELRSFLLTIWLLVLESTTNSLSSGSFVDAAGSHHASEDEYNVALSFSLSL